MKVRALLRVLPFLILVGKGEKDLHISLFNVDVNNTNWAIKDLPMPKPVAGGGPVGTVIAFPSYTPPTDYLLCDGSTFSRYNVSFVGFVTSKFAST